MNFFSKAGLFGKRIYSTSAGLSLIVVLLFVMGCGGSPKWKLTSPNGQVQVNVALNSDQSLRYTVKVKGTTVIENSALGMQLSNADLGSGLHLAEHNGVKPVSDDYTLVSGKQRHCTNSANEMSLTFQNTESVPLTLVLRAYNDGIAFRYGLTADAANPQQVTDELTEFNLPTPGKAYIAPYDTVARWAPAYETYYALHEIGETAAPNKNGWEFPLLFNVRNMWVLISESNLQAGYAAMHLDAECPDGVYRMHLPLMAEGDTTKTNLPLIAGKVSTPWRFINIAPTLDGIVESNLVTDLADDNALDDISWIKPGVASWGWWSGASARSYSEMKLYVDFARDMGWPYSLVDAGWEGMRGGDMIKLSAYAQSQGVGLLVWYTSGARPNYDSSRGPGFPVMMLDPVRRKAEFQKLQDWGVKGIKVDFFVTDKPYATRLYHDILTDAAANHLVVNFHGCTLPRGWRRTWPNLLGMEAILGCEAYRYDEKYPDLAPAHLTIAAVSRNAVGPMDYTPTAFSNSKNPHKTTYGFELALCTLLESGVVHFSDSVDSYNEQPEFVLDYMKNLPVLWDGVKYLDGVPGEFMIFARKSGDNWYIAGINALKSEKQVTLNLSKLGDGIKSVSLITDGENNTSFAQKQVNVDDGPVTVTMLPLGGFVGVAE